MGSPASSPGSVPGPGDAARAERPALPVPAKASRAAVAWQLLRDSLPSPPRDLEQARARVNRLVDRKVFRRGPVVERVTRTWARVGPAAASLPGAGLGYARVTERLADRLVRTKQPERAHEVLRAAAGLDLDDGARALLAARVLAMDMDRGIEPESIRGPLELALSQADAAWARGDIPRTADLLQGAFDLAFHRVRHFEGSGSPLAADPDAFLAPFRASTAWAALTSTGVRHDRPPVPCDRPRRVLFVTASGFHFAAPVIAEYETRPDVEVRSMNLLHQPGGPQRMSHARVVESRLRQVVGRPEPLDAQVREPFEWADVIVVEWSNRALAWVSTLPDLSARIVGRLHSYEAFTQFPAMTNWANVDDQIFVSEHIRQLVLRTVPALTGADAPRTHVIPNLTHLARYQRPKVEGAERVLGLVGWGQVVKDPMWALDVLERLREMDPAWRIRLVGHGFAAPEQLSAAALSYRDETLERISRLGDAVTATGFTDDVPAALRRVGVILSTSLREGTHEALLQGAASGAVPVVRDWPLLAAYGGPRTMVPDAWVVQTPEAAAERIAELAADPVAWAEAEEEARTWVRDHFDWAATKPAWDAVVLGASS